MRTIGERGIAAFDKLSEVNQLLLVRTIVFLSAVQILGWFIVAITPNHQKGLLDWVPFGATLNGYTIFLALVKARRKGLAATFFYFTLQYLIPFHFFFSFIPLALAILKNDLNLNNLYEALCLVGIGYGYKSISAFVKLMNEETKRKS